MTEPVWTISDLAQEFAVTPRTLRYYEDQGIISPARDGRNRVYSSRDRTRLKLALRGKRLGLQLSEILKLINMYDAPNDTSVQLKHYIDILEQHRSTLLQQQKDLNETLSEIQAQLDHCQGLLSQHS
jgi:DNA-binding transcriptional MerR regulator